MDSVGEQGGVGVGGAIGAGGRERGGREGGHLGWGGRGRSEGLPDNRGPILFEKRGLPCRASV